jgi:uncharacterized protein (DUF433 family)
MSGMGSMTVLERDVYSVVDAARVLGLAPQRARAWLDGYERRGVWYDPVIRPKRTGIDIVTWGEFVELGYLREYRRFGVSLQRLRPVIAELRERYQTPYPLALVRPFVHDRELVEQLQEDLNVPRSLALVIRTGQTVIVAERAERFFRKVVFDDLGSPGVAMRIRPAGKTSPVVIDPTMRFGRPSVDGVSTERLWELHDAGESVEEIADAYDMTIENVRAAISYEETSSSLAA